MKQYIDMVDAETKALFMQDDDIPFEALRKSCYAKTITADGQVGSINMSNIYSRLIQEAGRICEAYASDILIDLNTVDQWLTARSKSEYVPIIGTSYCFGFRKMGVDHWGFAQYRSKEDYYKLYRLDMKCQAGSIHAELYEAEMR